VPLPSAPQSAPGNAPIPISGRTIIPRRDNRPVEEDDSLRGWLQKAPPWMMSAVLHLVVLVVLGLIVFTATANRVQMLTLEENPWAEQLGDKLGEDMIDFETPDPDPNYKFITPQHLPRVADPFSAPPKVTGIDDPFGTAAASSEMPLTSSIGNALHGRQEGSRGALLKKYGGDKVTEAGVLLALQWLLRQQLEDGSWSLSGPFSDGVQPHEHASATAMALLAFLGNGHTHVQGLKEFKQAVNKGKNWLLEKQQENGTWRVDSGHHRLYVHGQCTIALCELYGMSKDTALRKAAERAVKYCVDSQSPQGGWRYNPSDQDADVSVTGWILMGLQSAKMAGLEVPSLTLKRISGFLDKCTKDGSHYSYLAGSDQTLPSMTAEALLCRQYLGWTRDNKSLQTGINYMLERLPKWERYDDFGGKGRDVYYWYYATQVIHHAEGKVWEKWNAAMKPALVGSQIKAGRERGSWDPAGDKWGPYGGRLYVTCLSTYMLEVYYRHLPLYSSVRLE
jgi:hypothetical protein